MFENTNQKVTVSGQKALFTPTHMVSVFSTKDTEG